MSRENVIYPGKLEKPDLVVAMTMHHLDPRVSRVNRAEVSDFILMIRS